jgi:hypothetical protein
MLEIGRNTSAGHLSLRNPPTFMEFEASLPCLQEPNNAHNRKSDETRLHLMSFLVFVRVRGLACVSSRWELPPAFPRIFQLALSAGRAKFRLSFHSHSGACVFTHSRVSLPQLFSGFRWNLALESALNTSGRISDWFVFVWHKTP